MYLTLAVWKSFWYLFCWCIFTVIIWVDFPASFSAKNKPVKLIEFCPMSFTWHSLFRLAALKLFYPFLHYLSVFITHKKTWFYSKKSRRNNQCFWSNSNCEALNDLTLTHSCYSWNMRFHWLLIYKRTFFLFLTALWTQRRASLAWPRTL